MADSCFSGKYSALRPTAQTLPDDVLLEIFHCHRQAVIEYGQWKWHRLTQVCRRWRSIIFAYPRHLDLRIVSTYNKSIRNAPKLWPDLPVIIWYPYPPAPFHPTLNSSDEDNIFEIFKNPARICEIDLDISRTQLAKYASLLEEPFPALDHLRLRSQDGVLRGFLDPIVLPIYFLNHSAPQLRVLRLKGTTIPTLPRLLSSNNLVSLGLEEMTHFPAAEDLTMALSTATQLKSLVLGFHSDTTFHLFRPQLGSPSSSSSRIVLPSLTRFQYRGESPYLRYFDSRINTPIIENINLLPFCKSRYDNTNGLCELFGLGELLRSSRCRATHLHFSTSYIVFSHHFSRILSTSGVFSFWLPFRDDINILELLLVAQVYRGMESQDALPKVTHLEIDDGPYYEQFPTRWLHLLRALTGLTTLYVSSTLSSLIVSALAQVTGETIREILPALKELHFGIGTPPSTTVPLAPFIAQRRRCGLPISIHFRKLKRIRAR
jgi:hypothetical protein